MDSIIIARTLNEIRTNRCGVIPYVIIEDLNGRKYVKDGRNYTIFFLLAKHKKTGELSDFGGGVKKMENSLQAGFREFHEESKEIFIDSYKSPMDIERCITLVDNSANMAEIFVPLDIKWLNDASYIFDSKEEVDEISDIVWISEYCFTHLILNGFSESHTIWKRIQNFLKKTIHSNEKFFQCLGNRTRMLVSC